MNWLDILLLVVFFLHLISGYSRGMVKQLFDIIGFIVIIFLSFWGSRLFSDRLAVFIDPEDIIPHHDLIQSLGLEVALEKAPQLIAGVVTFLLLLLALTLIFRLFSGGFRWINRVPVIGFFNRIGGAALGAVVGLIFVYIIITAVALIPLNSFMVALQNSEVVFLTEFYLTPLFDQLKEMVINYYLSLNG
ncbi:MAG: CvpA family protein [Bacillota bacterium]|nr:CvpA family protein [Bacillota bacterium]